MPETKRAEKAQPFEFNSWRDLTPLNTSVGTMLHNKTGSWRFIKPVYEDKTPACQNPCPAGNDIEGWIKLIGQKRYKEAYWHLKREQPFPAILGRVCFKFCENPCNRNGFDDHVNINELELFVGEQLTEPQTHPNLPEYNEKTLGIIGSGPAGMSAAYFCRLLGFQVTVFDALPELGGILRVGIPEYRLPGDVIDREFDFLKSMGIAFKPNTTIGKEILFQQLEEEYDYLFLASGVHKSRKLGIEGEDNTSRIMSGLEFLRITATGQPIDLGKKTVVIGGGNTAIDSARTALRLKTQVTVLYRRSEKEMPATPEEIEDARKEGVIFKFLATPESIELDSDGLIKTLTCGEMELGPVDSSGRRSPQIRPGVAFDIETDTILTAIGEIPAFEYLNQSVKTDQNLVVVANNLQAERVTKSKAKIFAGGDIIDIPHTVVHAVASGKKAAIAIDCDLNERDFSKVQQEIAIGNQDALSFSKYMGWVPLNQVKQDLQKVVEAKNIVFHYFEKVAPVISQTPVTTPDTVSFKPCRAIYSEEEAQQEATRCFHCGRCTECNNCMIFCPDLSALKHTGDQFGYEFDYDYCKGCGICFTECPRHAITMIDEATPIKEEA